MNANKQTRDLLISHYKRYPELKIQDIFKFVFHSAFGCDHLVSSVENAVSYIEKEYEGASKTEKPLTEELDGDYVRVHLSYLNVGLTAKTFGKLFCLSAKKEDGLSKLMEKLEVARALIAGGEIKLDIDEFDEALDEWRKLGFSAVRHSEEFREKYRPSYRVIAKKYACCLPVFAQIDRDIENGAVKLSIAEQDAIALSDAIKTVYGASVLVADDVMYVFPPENLDH